LNRTGDDRLALQGTKTMVPFADAVDLLLVAGRLDERVALVAVDRRAPGVRTTRLRTLGGEPQYEVRFDEVRVTDADVLACEGLLIDRALDHAATASLAYITGAAERALEMTVTHAKAREQFGRPIGAFQAVAHRCVDMRVDIDACRFLAYQAAWALDAGHSAELEVAAAKAFGNDALRRIFMHAHQVHGAVGFSTEHDLQLLSRRAKAFELTYGGTARQRERVAVAMGL
jgi:alkylation response protein AidB-like acyl-CoA dehydrogenase